MRLLASLFLAMGVYAQTGTALKESAQADYMAAKYIEAATKFSDYAAGGDKAQKVDGLYWEAMSRFQAVEQGDELLSRADSTCQALLMTASPDDSLYFAGQLLSSYMALKKDPKLALKRYDAASKHVPKDQKARYLWVGYLVNVKNRNLDRAQNLKSMLLKDYPDSPEASNVRMNDPDAQVAEVKVKPRVAPKRGQTVELKIQGPTVSQEIRPAEVAEAPVQSKNKIVPPKLEEEQGTTETAQATKSDKADSNTDASLATPKTLSKRELRAQAKAEKARIAAEKREAAKAAKAKAAEEKAASLAEAKAEAAAKAEELKAAKQKLAEEKALAKSSKTKLSTSNTLSLNEAKDSKKAKAEELKKAKAEKARIAAEKREAAKIAKAKAEKEKADKLAKAKEAKLAKDLKKAEKSGAKGDYFLQFGSFKSKESANTYAKSIQSKTGASGLKVVEHGGAFKVRLFGFSDKDQASNYAKGKIKSKGFDALVVQSQNP